MRRSTALMRITYLRQVELWSEEEFARFSTQMREEVDSLSPCRSR